MNIYNIEITGWELANWLYSIFAILSFIPVLKAILKKIELNPGGASFNDSSHFSIRAKELLNQHYSRIQGTLIFWKNKAEWHRRFHYYTLLWTIPVSIIIPIITQYIETSFESKLFLTIISTHSALTVAFHRALKVENNFKAFRHGESEFYDLYRQLLDRPKSFGQTEEEQMGKYFKEVDFIRRTVRTAETDNFPILDEIKEKN